MKLFAYLTLNVVIEMHRRQLARFGGAEGIRNRDGLEAAVEQPRATFDEEDLYPTVFDKAAVYAFHIAGAQAFVDGNKRTAIHAALTFLALNEHALPATCENALYNSMIAIANKEMNRDGLSETFRNLWISSLSI